MTFNEFLDAINILKETEHPFDDTNAVLIQQNLMSYFDCLLDINVINNYLTLKEKMFDEDEKLVERLMFI
jgi:hypothetical protein